jgi:ribosome-binding ATPase YchF (GTP1/OBG family)
VRVFEEKDTGVTHTEGACDPVRDLDIIRQELRMKDIDSITKAIPDAQKDVRATLCAHARRGRPQAGRLARRALAARVRVARAGLGHPRGSGHDWALGWSLPWSLG